ncbi:FAD-dependent oxidoreductase [Amycolatopsis alkalitolerans]|uniref:FAD-dependent oxidoreductase n=1 Tax=Amycolatopsis alkalitolerans TaxID=2547244 RepID=UPI00190F9D5C|nr:NAD(P)/FAD-dependent oxidoreductase [Amycolatopsis alkalitolerans]
MNEHRTALVIGGGIAGPVAAMALRRAGIEARVYEAYQGAADGVGGMLGLAPNGIDALDVLGAADAVRGIGEPVKSMIMRSWTGKRLAEFGGQDGEPVFHAVWRGELCRALYDEAARRDIKTEHGKRFLTAHETASGVIAEFDDGTSAEADLLIGADGIRSAVRSVIDPNAPQPRYTGLLGFGGETAKPVGLSSTNGSMHMIFGKRAFFAYFVYEDGHVGWFANLPRQTPDPRRVAGRRSTGMVAHTGKRLRRGPHPRRGHPARVRAGRAARGRRARGPAERS